MGGKRGEGRTISWVVRLGGALCDWLLGLEAEVIGGARVGVQEKNGRWKGLRHSTTTAGLARGLGLELAGWAGLGLGWRGSDVELELELQANLQSGVTFSLLHVPTSTRYVLCPPEYAANTGASVLSVWAQSR